MKPSWLLFALLVGISHMAAADPSSIDKQAIQTRVFEHPERLVFQAVVSVLQNNNYTGLNSDYDAGLVTAQLPATMNTNTAQSNDVTEGEMVARGVAAGVVGAFIPFGGLLVPQKQQTFETKTATTMRSLSATVSALGEAKTRVRVVFDMTTTTHAFDTGTQKMTQQTKQDDLTSMPHLYQEFFTQLDKEIFVRTSGAN